MNYEKVVYVFSFLYLIVELHITVYNSFYFLLVCLKKKIKFFLINK